MKKMKLFCGILIGLTIFSSCSTDNNDKENEPNNTNHLVKREYASNNVNLEYRYNENGNLTRILDIDIQEEIDSEINFTYNSNNIVKRNLVSRNSNYSSITNYSFNGSNRLLKAVLTINQPNNPINPIKIITQEFSYNNNIITVNIGSSTGDTRVVTLEVNNSELINKMIESLYYVVISYDTNGNISEIKVFDINDNLLNTTGYSYDNKPNPFHGQLKSIYLPLFLNAFIDAYFGEFVWDGYEGYYFPFLKNNITSLRKNGNLDSNFNYLYDNAHYPINVNEEPNVHNASEFDIEYE
ncbi:hypothetical protein [Aequorivita capsosiphonis]|uniref:hypothetical protein n=1 Tax=Aequorivita capsosiphonis TaxID=487317 RepID=UPI00040D5DA3|nr:hypothetical protein [Aequorivita capsosiphonis]